MAKLFGWNSQLMIGLFQKEATFGAGVTMTDANACSMKGYDVDVDFPDKVENDKNEVTGTEHGTDQEIIEKRFQMTYKEPKAKPNSVAGMLALVLGGITTTKDGEYNAWKHKIIPVTAGSALPTTQSEWKKGGIQYAHRGIFGKRIKLAGEAGGFVSLEALLGGSGYRAISSTAFAAKIIESWMRINQCKVWFENGANISIAATLTQHLENISSSTPVSLDARQKTFEFSFDNNNVEEPGFGGDGYLVEADPGRRKADLKFTLTFADGSELDHYLAQNPLAIEFDLKGGLIATSGSMYYGLQLIVPRFKLAKPPLPKGGPGDVLTCDFECDIQDDGTNPAVITEVYNAQDAYLAAAA